jgi:acetyltransferase
MGIRNLDKMFSPRSICIVGDNSLKDNLAHIVIQNLISGGFKGPILPVISNTQAIAGILCYPAIDDLPLNCDLALICHPRYESVETIERLAQCGVKAIILIGTGDQETTEILPLIKAARTHNIRLLGPNSMGAIIARLNLNASCFHASAKAGKIAFISQSPSLSCAVLDWANAHGIGFSHFITMGQSEGVSLGDLIDYLGSDPFTRAILIQMDSLSERRNFMSAARAAARNKPLVILKNDAISPHPESLNIESLVYDAAFRRAGMLRVETLGEMFAAAETLSVTRPFKGNRIAIVSNGQGLNTLITDILDRDHFVLANLSEDTCQQIQKLTGTHKQTCNPINLGLLIKPDAYAKAYEILKKSKEVDAIIFLHSPSYLNNSLESAQELVQAHKKLKGNILTCWLGEETVLPARKLFEENNIATYQTPKMAVMAISHILEYLETQKTLMQIPNRLPNDVKPQRARVKQLISDALSKGETQLNESIVKEILQSYQINSIQSYFVKNGDEAVQVANRIGFPVVLKLVTQADIKKSDVGGVVLSILSPQSLRLAIDAMNVRLHDFSQDAEAEGFIIQKMIDKDSQHEVRIAMHHDHIFGPVLLFGEGGSASEIRNDLALGLPPLNMALAKDLISRTNVSQLLKGYLNHDATNLDHLAQILVEISDLCIDFPEIQSLDINPFFVSDKGALAVDCTMKIQEITHKFPNRRLAIRPYPSELEEKFTLRNGREVLIRPIRPEDEPAHNDFVAKVSKEDIRFRFFGSVRELPHSEMARLTQIDYDREMAFIAVAPNEESSDMETLGVVRTGTDPNNDDAEYAILVRSDMKGQRLGWKLLNKMIEYCRSRGTKNFTGQILRENKTMIDMVKSMGFEAHGSIEGDIVEVKLNLQ